MARVVVIGAGAMGLAAAFRALEDGHAVTVLEAAPEAGGMAAHFDLGGLSIERFYHFVCKADQPTFDLLRRLGLEGAMRWRPTSMGYFIDGALHPWGDPVSLLRFPGLGLVPKLRYGALMYLATRRERWDALETLSAKEWIVRWCGQSVYDRLWRPLFDL
ncbi:MAG TPA: FAD-dependent oxidoreductase, partial [Bauldia sp.]|nr:FAD-dependent oxidoreductase [Bauldia sp.]